MLRGKSYRPAYGEPWVLVPPTAEQPWFELRDRHGVARLRTLGAGEEEGRLAGRVRNAVNGTVNFDDEQLDRLAEQWNENARRSDLDP